MPSNFTVFIKSLIFTQLFIFALIIGVSMDINSYYLFKNPVDQIDHILKPFSNIAFDEEDCVELIKKTSFVFTGDNNNSLLSSNYFRENMPRHLLASNIHALAIEDNYRTANVSRNSDRNIKLPAISLQEKELNTEADNYEILKKYQVIFYCTHSGESYIPDSGKAYLNGKQGLVNQVAATIAGTLNEKGVKASYINTVHDYPNYNESYTNSRATVKKILEKNNNKGLLLFDVHRDSIPGMTEAEKVKFNGKNAAPILIIVGTNERKDHPKWQENLELAERIEKTGERIYPGLIKGVRTKAGTYNQEFHTQSLLLEFGSDYNSMEETSYSAELFADIIIEMLKEATR